MFGHQWTCGDAYGLAWEWGYVHGRAKIWFWFLASRRVYEVDERQDLDRARPVSAALVGAQQDTAYCQLGKLSRSPPSSA